MIESVFLSVAMFALIGFAVVPKKIRSLESAFIWLLFTFLQANYAFIAGLNMKRIEPSLEAGKYAAYFCGLFILNPLLILGMLLAQTYCRTFAAKAVWWLIFAGLLTGLEYTEDYFGVVTHKHWLVMYSYLVWLGMLLLAIVAHGWFARILGKELRGTL